MPVFVSRTDFSTGVFGRRSPISSSEGSMRSGELATGVGGVFAPDLGASSPPGGEAMLSSTSEFHAPHASQRPDHFAWAVPQDWQT